jgi:hypothetical protein
LGRSLNQISMANPDVYYFNPTCELAVANGSFSYMPPHLLQEMERDLSILPFAFAHESDIVLTDNPPSPDFKMRLQNAGFAVPKFIDITETEGLPSGFIKSVNP